MEGQCKVGVREIGWSATHCDTTTDDPESQTQTINDPDNPSTVTKALMRSREAREPAMLLKLIEGERQRDAEG